MSGLPLVEQIDYSQPMYFIWHLAKNPLGDKGVHDLMGIQARNLTTLNLSISVSNEGIPK